MVTPSEIQIWNLPRRCPCVKFALWTQITIWIFPVCKDQQNNSSGCKSAHAFRSMAFCLLMCRRPSIVPEVPFSLHIWLPTTVPWATVLSILCLTHHFILFIFCFTWTGEHTHIHSVSRTFLLSSSFSFSLSPSLSITTAVHNRFHRRRFHRRLVSADCGFCVHFLPILPSLSFHQRRRTYAPTASHHHHHTRSTTVPTMGWANVFFSTVYNPKANRKCRLEQPRFSLTIASFVFSFRSFLLVFACL